MGDTQDPQDPEDLSPPEQGDSLDEAAEMPGSGEGERRMGRPLSRPKIDTGGLSGPRPGQVFNEAVRDALGSDPDGDGPAGQAAVTARTQRHPGSGGGGQQKRRVVRAVPGAAAGQRPLARGNDQNGTARGNGQTTQQQGDGQGPAPGSGAGDGTSPDQQNRPGIDPAQQPPGSSQPPTGQDPTQDKPGSPGSPTQDPTRGGDDQNGGGQRRPLEQRQPGNPTGQGGATAPAGPGPAIPAPAAPGSGTPGSGSQGQAQSGQSGVVSAGEVAAVGGVTAAAMGATVDPATVPFQIPGSPDQVSVGNKALQTGPNQPTPPGAPDGQTVPVQPGTTPPAPGSGVGQPSAGVENGPGRALGRRNTVNPGSGAPPGAKGFGGGPKALSTVPTPKTPGIPGAGAGGSGPGMGGVMGAAGAAKAAGKAAGDTTRALRQSLSASTPDEDGPDPANRVNPDAGLSGTEMLAKRGSLSGVALNKLTEGSALGDAVNSAQNAAAKAKVTAANLTGVGKGLTAAIDAGAKGVSAIKKSVTGRALGERKVDANGQVSTPRKKAKIALASSLTVLLLFGALLGGSGTTGGGAIGTLLGVDSKQELNETVGGDHIETLRMGEFYSWVTEAPNIPWELVGGVEGVLAGFGIQNVNYPDDPDRSSTIDGELDPDLPPGAGVHPTVWPPITTEGLPSYYQDGGLGPFLLNPKQLDINEDNAKAVHNDCSGVRRAWISTPTEDEFPEPQDTLVYWTDKDGNQVIQDSPWDWLDLQTGTQTNEPDDEDEPEEPDPDDDDDGDDLDEDEYEEPEDYDEDDETDDDTTSEICFGLNGTVTSTTATDTSVEGVRHTRRPTQQPPVTLLPDLDLGDDDTPITLPPVVTTVVTIIDDVLEDVTGGLPDGDDGEGGGGGQPPQPDDPQRTLAPRDPGNYPLVNPQNISSSGLYLMHQIKVRAWQAFTCFGQPGMRTDAPANDVPEQELACWDHDPSLTTKTLGWMTDEQAASTTTTVAPPTTVADTGTESNDEPDPIKDPEDLIEQRLNGLAGSFWREVLEDMLFKQWACDDYRWREVWRQEDVPPEADERPTMVARLLCPDEVYTPDPELQVPPIDVLRRPTADGAPPVPPMPNPTIGLQEPPARMDPDQPPGVARKVRSYTEIVSRTPEGLPIWDSFTDWRIEYPPPQMLDPLPELPDLSTEMIGLAMQIAEFEDYPECGSFGFGSGGTGTGGSTGGDGDVPAGAISDAAIAAAAASQGLSGESLAIAVAVALGESSGNPRAHNSTPPDDSYGLWQINMIGRLGPDRAARWGLSSYEELFDPATNARAMMDISGGGTNWRPWSVYTSGKYLEYMDRGRAAAAGAPPPPPGGTGPPPPGSSDPHTALSCFLSGGGGVGGGVGTVVGNYAFPLIGPKSVVNNPGMFRGGTASQGGHPYIAYDILADPNVPVAAFLDGVVTRITQDRCPGRMISVHSPASDMTISYLHLAFNGHVGMGDTVRAGQQIAVVGPAAAGCGTPHLHIDASAGSSRPGCSRLNCPSANQARFRDIGGPLFETFQALPG